jgi:ketosteroid isomerase-like protein
VQAELEHRLAQLEDMTRRAVPPEDIAHFLYWPDVVVAGEGLERAYHSLPDMLPMFCDVVSNQLSRDCSWRITHDLVHSGDVAATFLQVTSRYGEGQPDANFCALYVWERRQGDWKVIREQVSLGLMR